jgi:hypothetical protein
MFIGIEKQIMEYTRKSKLGHDHNYKRTKTVAKLRCDNCDTMFFRDLKKMDYRRLSNNYFHVCKDCDAKRFAQRKGIERKQIWDMPASSMLPVGKY